jgi:hypothetical protein
MYPYLFQVPQEWAQGYEKLLKPEDYFSEMSPIFCTTDVPHDVIGDHMQAYATSRGMKQGTRRLLIGGMSAKKILLATPLLKWYLANGITIDYIYQAVEYQPKTCFKQFQEDISTARREGDADKSKSILADSSKLAGNSLVNYNKYNLRVIH